MVGHAWSSPFISRARIEQIGESDRLVAVGTAPSGADSPAELLALRAALLAQIPRAAGRALVHRGRVGRVGGQGRQGCGVAPPPGRLAAGRRAEALPADRDERTAAARAGYRHAIVTARA